MEEFWKKESDERWQKVCELSFVVGYLKAELRVKGYTPEQVEKLEQEAKAAYAKWNTVSESPSAK